MDDFDQGIIIGNAARESRYITLVKEGTKDQDFTACTSSINSAYIESVVNVNTLEIRFKERIDREMSNIVDTVENRIHNPILTAIDDIVEPKIELAIRSKNATSGRDATSVAANCECRKHVEINASFENASGNNNVQQLSNGNDETRNNIPDEVSELLVSGTLFDRQTHTHHMVTGQTIETNQAPEFHTGRILTSRNPPSNQHQNLSTQLSQDNNLPMVE